MQTSTSLTFFTASFVAVGGVLAEELMIKSSCQNRYPEMLSTSNFYDGNMIYMVWKDKLA